MITYDDFAKIEMRVGKILSAEPILKSDKLLKLSVSFGFKEDVQPPPEKVRPPEKTEEVKPTETAADVLPVSVATEDVRQILSGIAKHFPDPQTLVGRKCMFVTNLAPRMMMGLESNGMILAVSTDDGGFSLLEPDQVIPEGTKAR